MPDYRQLFADAPTICVRGVELSATDERSTHREKFARVILDELYEFVGLLDADGNTLEINRAALEGAGISIDDIAGRPFWEARWWAVSHDVQAQCAAMVERARRGEFVRCDVEVFGREGGTETIVVDYSLTPICDHTGRVVFLLPEGRNITDKKRAEDELARRSEELQQLLDRVRELDSAKSTFFANVSHELRTPLTLILGPVDELLDDASLTAANRRSLEVVRRNAETLLKQVNSLLDLARVEAGQMQLDYARLDLATLVRTATSHFDAIAAQRSINFIVETPQSLVAEVDGDKLDRVILNLLSNAFKFTQDGGRIRCRLELMGNQRALLTVHDSGPGVPVDERSAIFGRFRQGSAAGTAPGSGLGLAIVREFVDLHGGTIAVTDAPGGGAAFQIEIPLAAPAAAYVRRVERPSAAVVSGERFEAPEADADGDNAVPAGRPHVLVVEDHPDMRRFVVDSLRSEFDVTAVRDGVDAIAEARARPPDIVVTDLMMPRLSGGKLVAELRSIPDCLQVPVLVLSARADDDLRVQLLAGWVQDYVTKPFSVHELRARVRNLVVAKKARDVLQGALASSTDDLTRLAEELVSSYRAVRTSHDLLSLSEERWRAVFDHSAAGIALLTPDGQIISLNEAFRRMLGLAETAEPTRLDEIAFRDDLADMSQQLAQLGNSGEGEFRTERRLRRADGATLWVDASVSMIPANGTSAALVLCIAEDITARRQAESDLAKAQAQLSRVTRANAMGELAASIAHELNQPLAAICTNAQAFQRWLTGEPRNEPEAIAAVNRIARDASRASDVIVRIRQFLGRESAPMEAVPVGDVVRDVTSMLANFAAAHDVTVRLHGLEAAQFVHGDRVQLEQVFFNIIMNAVEAMTASPRPRIVDVRAERRGGSVVVEVRDYGAGLDPADANRIFEPFYTTKSCGLGMGLAISRSIIDAHGGQLGAATADGPGTTFVITLPVADDHGTDEREQTGART